MTTREDGSKVIQLKGKDLPRNDKDDVEFTSLEEVQEHFSDDEIKTLVERAIYHMEYQRTHHKKYSQKLRDLEKPVKIKAKEMFPGIAFINLTTKQYIEARDAAFAEIKEQEND